MLCDCLTFLTATRIQCQFMFAGRCTISSVHSTDYGLRNVAWEDYRMGLIYTKKNYHRQQQNTKLLAW